ncbi:lysophospholipid acyltransferase family protein [Thermoactinomyces mirandus]|uniref:1-acyl-sn-glycerol-3-phosphate acyltransferase n=1 Tax=Thermoactinomyces mirandus TaxID=2756294 RepID=A0A7W1XUW9_9BACL|nr:lysophospholipid acyltransferase family protein [Thermoactinomyces mirandus]MBA4603705.1 1-acyl-sn-glycerol-3-phosphate acyltransferase [Thermoactinomyces mirandus]
MLYRFIRVIARFLMKLLFLYKTTGTEHIPEKGPVVLCCNHISNLDPPLLAVSIERKVHFMAKAELFRIPVLGSLIQRLGAFPVKRGAGDRQALKKAIQLLKDGHTVGIFPEGTRSKTGEMGPFHFGAALIALKGKAPIVPVAICGSFRLFRPIRIVFGSPIDVAPFLQEKVGTATAKQVTELVVNEIRSLKEQTGE